MIGFWATLSLNMPDFTRFGRSQREQVVGQVVALPTTMAVFAAMGVLITSATVAIYGEAMPAGRVAGFVLVWIALIVLTVDALGTLGPRNVIPAPVHARVRPATPPDA